MSTKPRTLFEKVSTETQLNCYEAFFEALWAQEWFAGVHIWQWSLADRKGGLNNTTFTPQNKPAQNCIATWFAR